MELRSFMRRVPAAVAIVTVEAGGARLGLTVSSFVSLSLEPPLVAVAIAKQAALHELLREAGAFTVNVLAGGQDALAQRFARGVPPIALWDGVALREGDGAPRLDGALGWIECAVAAEHDSGDHTLFVGEVRAVEAGPPAAALVFVDGGYRAL